MEKYKITWNVGYGPTSEILEFASLEEAVNEAYERAKEEFEMNAEYHAELVMDGEEDDE